MSKLHFPKVTPLMTAAAVTIAQAFILAIAFAAAGSEMPVDRLWLIPVVALLAGALAALFHARSWHALLLAFLISVVVGDIGALDLAQQPVEQIFAVTAATVIFFMAIGLLIGFIAEVVRFCHYLLHGGRIKLYPWGKKPKE
jgi:lysylphosphatidylglycerol synthetase-like protein (DUF2156 family)